MPVSDPLAGFLAGSGYAGWTREPLPGDASARRYVRLTGPDGQTAIVMCSSDPPDSFLAVAGHLARIGLCPPRILRTGHGMLLIEDLGALHVAAWLAQRPADEVMIYAVAVDVLAVLRQHSPPPGLLALTPAHAAGMIAPLTEWYAPAAALPPLVRALEQALLAHAPLADTLALRDFHAENLIWRPDRAGTDRLGLLDFQDAVLAPAEYDLVSLLRDARRDVAPATATAMIERFARLTHRPADQCRAACACLGVQRNLRILGIFARLAQRDGKRRYLDLIPRVWGHLQHDLSHPAMAAMASVVARSIPAPV